MKTITGILVSVALLQSPAGLADTPSNTSPGTLGTDRGGVATDGTDRGGINSAGANPVLVAATGPQNMIAIALCERFGVGCPGQ